MTNSIPCIAAIDLVGGDIKVGIGPLVKNPLPGVLELMHRWLSQEVGAFYCFFTPVRLVSALSCWRKDGC